MRHEVWRTRVGGLALAEYLAVSRITLAPSVVGALDLEELARTTLERCNLGPPVDAEEIALELGLEVRGPTSEPYDRWQIKLHKLASAVVQEWADIIGFATEPVLVRKEDVGFQRKVRRGIGQGERLLHVSPSPAGGWKRRRTTGRERQTS